jgi:glycosyltransferase involved in cell wall biosynthesis
MASGDRLIGVLPTYRRQGILQATLARIGAQTRPPDHLILVDNERSAKTEAIAAAADLPLCEYLPLRENMGFAGGVAAGMRRALEFADDDDWIVLLDDDDPPTFDDALETLATFAAEMRTRDPQTAAIGISGGWFDWRRGRLRRVPDSELTGAVPLDHVASGGLPLYLVASIRRVGPFCDEIFFGFSELEFGLRLWTAGYSLYGHGPLWLESRRRTGRLNHELRPSRRLGAATWRDYYTLRNAIFILRRFGHAPVAARVTFVHGLAKPLVNLPIDPGLALTHLGINLRAGLDGWLGRMGKRVEPDGSFRVEKIREPDVPVDGR